MCKVNIIIISFLTIIFIAIVLLLFSNNSIHKKTNEILYSKLKENNYEYILELILQNQQYIKSQISELDIQLNSKTLALVKAVQKENNHFNNNLLEIQKINRNVTAEIKELLVFYQKKVEEVIQTENYYSSIKIVESDYLQQQLLTEGFVQYSKKKFSKAIDLYSQILKIDSYNSEALCYYNASIFYQNPGDGSLYYGIKRDLIPILEAGNLPVDMELTILNLLIGIGREEGNSDKSEKYLNRLNILVGVE